MVANDSIFYYFSMFINSFFPLLPSREAGEGVRITKYAVLKSLPPGGGIQGEVKMTQDQWDTILI
jgi:hypothetical protein